MMDTMTNNHSQLLRHIAKELCVPCSSIDLSQSFAQLGGHSLSAIRLSHTCRRHGISLPVAHILKARSLTSLIKLAKGDRPKTVHLLRQCNADASQCPLTEIQLSLIRGSQAAPGNNVISYHHFCHREGIPQLRDAWRLVLDSEPIFQTELRFENGRGYLQQTSSTKFAWRDVLADSEDDLRQRLNENSAMEAAEHSFRLIRVRGSDQCCIIWDVHHALIDGYSMQLLLKKLQSVLEGHPIKRGPSFMKISRELQDQQQRSRTLSEKYWLSRSKDLARAMRRLKLPKVLSSEPLYCQMEVQVPMADILCHATHIGVTAASMFVAAWAAVLSCFSDSDDVGFGIALSGRSLRSLDVVDVVGPLVNVLPFCATLRRSTTSSTFIRTIFDALADLSEFEWSPPSHGYDRSFDTLLAMQFESHPIGNQQLASAECQTQVRMRSDVPLTILVFPTGLLSFQYSSDKVPTSIVQAMSAKYTAVLQAFTNTKWTLEMCQEHANTSASRAILFEMGNCISGLTTMSSVQDDLVSIFLRTARLNLQEFALERDMQQVSYHALLTRATLVATKLSTVISAGEVVTVHADQSIDWIVAIYGILLARGIYCGLNGNLSQQMRQSMFETSGSKVFLVSDDMDKSYRPDGCHWCFSVAEMMKSQDQPQLLVPCIDSNWEARPSSIAYLCYTSGSTGKPKGVQCTHQGLVAFQRDFNVRLCAQRGERIAQIMSPSFDGSIHEIFSALSYGATLVLPDTEDMFAHLHRVDTTVLTPSIAAVLNPKDYRNLARVYLVGEAVPQTVNDIWSSAMPTFNMYGPTEATCGATIKELKPGLPVTIGRPNSSTRIYILDRNLRLAPLGVVGQIFLAGVQVSLGYLDRPDATAESFFKDTICPQLNEMMYRTGDLGCWSSTGELMCLGRNDRQMKLRGYRIELDDIEARIDALDEVRMSAVTVVEDSIVAMIQPEHVDIEKMFERFRGILPAHAIPNKVLAVKEFPRTTAGKVDYNAIKVAARVASTSIPKKVRTATETKIAAHVQAELDVSPVDHRDAFASDLGWLDSMQQLRLASKLTTAFETRITVQDIIKTATMSCLADLVDSRLCQTQIGTSSARSEEKDSSCISYTEDYWVQRYAKGIDLPALNVSFGVLLASSVSRSRLIAAWNQILSRYEILRSRFTSLESGRTLRSLSLHPPTVQVATKLDPHEIVDEPFCLDSQDLIRVKVSDDMLIVVASHIICDLTSLQILLNDVAKVYEGIELPRNQQGYIASGTWEQEVAKDRLDWWSATLRRATHSTTLDRSLPHVKQDHLVKSGSSHCTFVPSAICSLISDHVRSTGLTYHQLCLTAVGLALTVEHDSTIVVLGGPHFNRHSEQDLCTVGLFLQPIPIAIDFDIGSQRDSVKVSDLLSAVRTSSQESLSNVIPWNHLASHLQRVDGLMEEQMLHTMVTFHDQKNAPSLAIDGTDSIYLFSAGAKFRLMCEFSQLADDSILLRIEHDGSWKSEEILQFEHVLFQAFIGITSGDMSYARLKLDLRCAKASFATTARGQVVLGGENLIGKSTSELRAYSMKGT